MENGSNNYHFITHWQIRGPIEVVYAVLRDGSRYSSWWRPACRISEEVGPGKIRSVIRAKLPYVLDFTTELVRENQPDELELRVMGDLVGTGLWSLRQTGEVTGIDFFWDVQATKPLLRLLSFLLKPLFRWNHNRVMRMGEKRLAEQIIHSTQAPNA